MEVELVKIAVCEQATLELDAVALVLEKAAVAVATSEQTHFQTHLRL